MKVRLLYAKKRFAEVRQKQLLILTGSLLLVNILLSLTLLFRSERTVIVPPGFTQKFWVQGNKVSASYVEELALFWSSFILEISPESAAIRRAIILRHVSPSGYGRLKHQLIAQEKRIQKLRVVTCFQPIKVTVRGMQAAVTGDLIQFLGEKRISQTRNTYDIDFALRHGQVLVQRFQKREKKDA